MQTITIPQGKQVITHVVFKKRKPVFFWGQPGVGKSDMVAQAVEELGGLLVDIRLSMYDSVDLRGIPNVQQVPVPPHCLKSEAHYFLEPSLSTTIGLTTWNIPATMPFKGNPHFEQHKDKPIFIFFDEMNSCSPAVFAVAFQMVLNFRCGENVFMDNVYIIAAGNREGDKGVTTRMPTPLANRFTHYEIGVDVDAWCAYAQARGVPQVALAFYQFRKPLLNTFDPKSTDKAFSTPRTAEVGWKDYYADASMPLDIKQASMAGVMGDGPAAEAWGFIDVWSKMVPLPSIEKSPLTVAVPDEPSMQYAVSVAISGALSPKNIKAFYAYMSRKEWSPEFVVLMFQLAVRRDAMLYETDEYIAFAKLYKAVFTA